MRTENAGHGKQKKEAELREAKRREDEWDRITQEVIDTDAFKNTVETIRKEEAVKQKSQEQ